MSSERKIIRTLKNAGFEEYDIHHGPNPSRGFTVMACWKGRSPYQQVWYMEFDPDKPRTEYADIRDLTLRYQAELDSAGFDAIFQETPIKYSDRLGCGVLAKGMKCSDDGLKEKRREPILR